MDLEYLLESLPDSLENILADPRCRTAGFCNRLLDRAETARFSDPKKSLDVANCALNLALLIPASHDRWRELLLRALTVYGGACRRLYDFTGAEAAYLAAIDLILDVDDPRQLAHFCGRLAFLRRDQRRMPEALELALQAVKIGSSLRDLSLYGETLTYLGTVFLYDGSFAEAIGCGKEALKALPKEEIDHRRAAVHIIVTALSRSDEGEPREVYHWLARAKEIDAKVPADSMLGVNLRWLEGLAHCRAGTVEDAATALWSARTSLLELGLGYHAAVVSMDLAILYLERDRPEDAAALAGEMFPVFKSLRVDREATAALKLFVNAASAGQLTVDLVQEVKRRIDNCAAAPTGRGS